MGCDTVDSESLVTGSAETSKGLVAWWRFDEGVGETGQDASGFGHTGFIRNGDWGDGKVGSSLRMDGGNNSIMTVPMSDALRSTADGITVMAWAYRTADHNVAVLAQGYPALFFGFHGSQFKWQIRSQPKALYRALRRLPFMRRIARTLGYSPAAECYVDPEDGPSVNRWIHLAGTYDGRRARLFVNGSEVCSEPMSGPISMTDGPFTISGYLDETGEIVDEITGDLDELRIYARALSAAEIGGLIFADREGSRGQVTSAGPRAGRGRETDQML
jgi:hypothetical protein